MRTILITGAASGLGWEMTQRFHERGDRLYLVDQNAELLAERAAMLNTPDRVSIGVANLATSEGIAVATTGFKCWSDHLDVLVNNAGIAHRSLAGQTQPSVLKTVMAVDWQAPVELTLALLPLLRQSHGSLITIGSMAGWMPVMGRAGYCSAKAALSQFFEVLRAEEADNGIHLLMVYPSFLATDIEQNALGGNGEKARHARSTVGKVGDAGELAAAIVTALDKRQPNLFPDRFTWLSSLLWRLAPGVYHHLMRRRFAAELQHK